MEKRIDILNELKELSPTLAALEKVNVFTVPEGYFEYLGADMLMRIEKEKGPVDPSANDVPAGYFDTLATSILAKIKGQEAGDAVTEINSLSPQLAGLKQINTFEVPEGYFDTFSTAVLAGINGHEATEAVTGINGLSPQLSGIRDMDTFKVPDDYFNTLAATILAKIKAIETEDAATEIRALSPMLYSVQNENVFEVPTGYFKGLEEKILNTVSPKAKVVSMKSRTATFFKYAVAAAFTGVMALGVFKFTGAPTEKIELPDYVTAGLQVKNVDQELAKIADDDIVKYLEANGTDVTDAVVANSVDENELPAQEDYLLDEKALDKYLNSINIDDLKN